jgi:hypothetical protein
VLLPSQADSPVIVPSLAEEKKLYYQVASAICPALFSLGFKPQSPKTLAFQTLSATDS